MRFRSARAGRWLIPALAFLLLAACAPTNVTSPPPAPTVPPVATGAPAALSTAAATTPTTEAAAAPAATPAAAGATTGASSAATPAAGGAAAAGGATELTISTDTGSELKFVPAEATVKSGATVKLTFKNASTLPHNLTFQQGIDAKTQPAVAPGQSETIQFTAPAPGTYKWACTLHPPNMVGTLTVQ